MLHINLRWSSWALVHFKDTLDAATFYNIYGITKKVVCMRLADVVVNPALIEIGHRRYKKVVYVSLLYRHALINYPATRRPIKIYDIQLPIVDSYDNLGVPMTATGITVPALLNKSASKAKKAMQLMRRIGVHQYGFGLMLALRIYRVFIRPVMEFAVAILGLNATTSMVLDKAQGRCLNMCLNRGVHLCAEDQRAYYCIEIS